MATKGEETAEQDELEAQLRTATEGLQRAVMRLLQDKDIPPHLVMLALARVTGEVGAGTALAGGQDPEALLGELAGRASWGRASGRARVSRDDRGRGSADRGERLRRNYQAGCGRRAVCTRVHRQAGRSALTPGPPAARRDLSCTDVPPLRPVGGVIGCRTACPARRSVASSSCCSWPWPW